MGIHEKFYAAVQYIWFPPLYRIDIDSMVRQIPTKKSDKYRYFLFELYGKKNSY